MCIPFVSCLFGPGACCCCVACPSFRNSILTRINYGIMLLVPTVICAILLSPAIGTLFEEVRHPRIWEGRVALRVFTGVVCDVRYWGSVLGSSKQMYMFGR